MNELGTSIKRIGAGLMALLLCSTPTVALAAAGAGPGRKQVLMFGGIALLAWVAMFFVCRWIYGLFLDWRWPVDFALGIVIAAFLLITVTIFLFVFLFLWAQPWSAYAWYGVAGVWVLLLLFALVGRNRQSA